MSNPNNLTSVGNFVSQSVTTSNIVCHNLNVSTALNVEKINDTTAENLASLDTTISISGSLSALEGGVTTAINTITSINSALDIINEDISERPTGSQVDGKIETIL